MAQRIELAASLMCGDYRRLGHQVRELDAAGIDRYHLDVMDGHFVPNLGLGPELVAGIRGETNKPFDAHLMVSEPERFVDLFAEAGCQTIIVHLESTIHLRRIVARIIDVGCSPGIAVNPATSIEPLTYLYSDVTQVIVMTVDAGFKAQPFTANVLPKMATIHRRITEGGYHAAITADGSVNRRTIDALVEAGSRILVLGSTGLFNERDFAAALTRVRAQAEAAVVA
jgi:ribulose-phosphate 3-epimerase